MEERIRELLEEAVQGIFLEMQGCMGIETGDLDPLLALKLEMEQKKFADVIGECLTWQENNAEFFKQEGER